uniref:Uncharacterized protein n=1 Tax=Populus trichocarpa TaxID=3694 RepID=B9IIL2_POPTR
MASADSATAAEERCGFCWFHHYGLGRIWLRRRLQLGGWFSSFLVAVGAGHGSAEVVLLAAGIFRGRPRVKACKWCSQWLQAGEVRSGEGRREACVQRESLLRKGEEQ